MRPLLVLRPEPGASATARAAELLGLKPLVIPLFEVRPLGWPSPDPEAFDALLLTSANALRHGGEGIKGLSALPAYCVGEATAAEARKVGLAVAATGAAGVDSLLASIPRRLRLLHLCGADRRHPAAPNHSITEIPVYESVELSPTSGFEGLEGSVAALHSPRAAAAFARRTVEAGLDRSTIALAAISAETASAAGEGWQSVTTAAKPSDSAILAIASRLCNNLA